MSATVDTTKLTVTLKRYAQELNLSLRKVVRHQAGLLKADIVDALPPRLLAKSKKQAEKDARHYFRPGATKDGKAWTVFAGAQAGRGQTRWLYAGPTFLAGVATADFQPGMTVDQMRRIMGESQLRGAAWHDLGQFEGIKGKSSNKGLKFRREYKPKRGQQHVMLLRRTVVLPSTYKALVKAVQNNFGRLKASFAVDWELFQIARPLRAWIAQHLPNAKGRTVDMSFNMENPYVELISTASGVSHEKSIKAIRAGVKKRVGAMTADLRNQLNGAYKRAGFANAR